MSTRSLKASIALVATVGVLVAAAGRSEGTHTTSSTCATVLGSEVCTWVVMEQGIATELGATVPLTLVESVPADAEMVWPPAELASVPFPLEAREQLGIDHLGINWEAHGHPPQSFLAQHFDFHFYSISEDEVSAIDCSDGSKPTDAPAHYALPDIDVPGLGVLQGLCVPAMGMHAMPEGEVHETDPFAASMMIGYYQGRPIFFEPMVSRDLLLERSDFALAMPRVMSLPQGVRYPSAFRAEYDDTRAEYELIFTGFNSE